MNIKLITYNLKNKHIKSMIEFLTRMFINIRSTSEFSNEKNRVDRRVQYYKCRTRRLFIQDMSAYLDWITQAGIVCTV